MTCKYRDCKREAHKRLDDLRQASQRRSLDRAESEAMNRILNIPAEHLHPGDRIVGPHLGIYAPGTTLEVREPGVYRTAHTPQACVEVAVFGPDPGYPWTARRLHTLTIAAAWAFDIDRPNLVIPGLERDPFDGVGIMDDHAHGDNCDYCASKEHARPAPRPASPTINRDHWGR